jgi:hypothetical protein
MQKKTALRILSKLLPKSSDLDALMRRDEEALLSVEAVDARRAEIVQPSTAKSTLDAFGGLAVDEATSPTSSQEEAPSTAVGEEEGGGQVMQPGADEQSAAFLSSSTEGMPAAADLNAAYERGKQDKAAGNRRTALPGEYRGAANTKKADAWFAGYDGKPMPRDDKELI